MSRNQVRGPSSALSSFLRERGIRAPQRSVWERRGTAAAAGAGAGAGTTSPPAVDPDEQEEDEAVAAPPPASHDDDDDDDDDSEDVVPTARRRTARNTRRRNVQLVGDDEGDREEEEEGKAEVEQESVLMQTDANERDEMEVEVDAATTTTRIGRRKVVPAKAKGKGKAPAKGKKRKSKGSDYSDGDDDLEDDAFAAPVGGGRSAHTKRRKVAAKEGKGIVNSVQICNRCRRRYVVGDDQRVLCPACVMLQVVGGAAPKKPRKRQGAAVADGEDAAARGGVRSLRDMCIKLLADHIDSIEEFGDISEATKLHLAKIIGRQRQLTSSNVNLFIGSHEERVHLFECTYLDDAGLAHVARNCPAARLLHLGNCGRIRDETLKLIGDECPNLESLTLDGPFLPSDAGFADMFKGLGDKLKHLTLRHAAKLNHGAVRTLVDTCPNLVELRLDGCLKLDDEGVRLLAGLKDLQVVEIGFMGQTISEESLIYLIENIGGGLRALLLNGHENLNDKVLTTISTHCTRLQEISLAQCTTITSEGMLSFIRSLRCVNGLSSLNLSRNVHLADDVVVALVNQHGNQLTNLDLNGLDDLTEYALRALSAGVPNMRNLDVSWVRNVDDFMLDELVQKSRHLVKVKVYGCNKLSDVILNRRNVNDDDVELRFVGNEYI
ncbi:hypothetical protein HKX48_000171 [Thoreauomyces humboldtii]|nr:hypothetical protein HKX48_000171 [Thoreauomyces humboldtii]